MEQRAKDLQGYAGQVREFCIDQFLSDWEDPGMPVPWTVGDHALPDPGLIRDPTASSSGEAPPAAATNESFITALGQKLVVKVLILPGYVASGTRSAETGAIWRELQQVMPQYELSTCQCVGPFVDDFGHAAEVWRKADLPGY